MNLEYERHFGNLEHTVNWDQTYLNVGMDPSGSHLVSKSADAVSSTFPSKRVLVMGRRVGETVSHRKVLLEGESEVFGESKPEFGQAMRIQKDPSFSQGVSEKARKDQRVSRFPACKSLRVKGGVW